MSLIESAVELLTPARVPVARDAADRVAILAEQSSADRQVDARLRARHVEALRRPRNAKGATRALSALRAHRERAAAAAARLDTATGSTAAAVPALLTQVVAAIESSSGSGHRTAAGPHRSPIGLSAAALVGDIERVVGYGPRTQLVTRCWAWVRAHAGDPAAPDVLAAWVARCHGVLDPPRPVELAAPCPVCQRRTVLVVDDTGERVRHPALAIDRVSGTVSCAGCRTTWGPELWEFLARVLTEQAATSEQAQPGGQDQPDPDQGADATDPPPATHRVRSRARRLTPAGPAGDHPRREG